VKKILFVLIFVFLTGLAFGQTIVEEEILINNTNLLRYSLSNDISEIEKQIEARAGVKISLSDIQWTINPLLDDNVKIEINRLNVNYSMTTYTGPFIPMVFYRYVIVNRRVGDNWFIYMVTTIEE